MMPNEMNLDDVGFAGAPTSEGVAQLESELAECDDAAKYMHDSLRDLVLSVRFAYDGECAVDTEYGEDEYVNPCAAGLIAVNDEKIELIGSGVFSDGVADTKNGQFLAWWPRPVLIEEDGIANSKP